ncbi:MAG: CoA transferase [Chloroflexota bacterium]|nr:CoA transferase [Chloroflexota bacterium]
MRLLEGIRVLELGGHTSAPFCARLLADYGADIIKVEPPGLGDPARSKGPFAGDDPNPEKSLPFLYLNTNKRGITLDIECPTGRLILDRLLSETDVLVENFSPALRDSLSLDFDSLAAVNPSLVAVSITPFGLAGPYRDQPAEDIEAFAWSGHLYHSGDSDREPLHNALDQAWYVAGVNAATAAAAALFQRLFTGRGQQVEVSASECLAAHMVQAVPYFNYMGAIKGRRPIRGSGFEELMPARDGYVVPSVQGSQPWSVVADLIGLEELEDEKFSSGSGRIEHGEELKELVARGLSKWDRKPLFEASGQRRLVFGMAQDSGDLYDCPHLEERGYFVQVDHPVAGSAPYAGFGPCLSSYQYEITRPAPLLGQHNQEIYGDSLGLSDLDLVCLRAGGIV